MSVQGVGVYIYMSYEIQYEVACSNIIMVNDLLVCYKINGDNDKEI
jgi:hypothetical protein